jgi:hypothetical protein
MTFFLPLCVKNASTSNKNHKFLLKNRNKYKLQFVVGCTTGISLLLNAYVVFTAGVVRHGQVEACDMKSEYHDIMKIITVVDSLLTLVVPSVLIVLMNSVIIRNLMEFRQQLRVDMGAEDSSEPSNSIPMVSLRDEFGCFVICLGSLILCDAQRDNGRVNCGFAFNPFGDRSNPEFWMRVVFTKG